MYSHTKLTQALKCTLCCVFFFQSLRRLACTSSRAQYALLCAARSALCAALYFCQLALSAARRSSPVAYTRGRAMMGNAVFIACNNCHTSK